MWLNGNRRRGCPCRRQWRGGSNMNKLSSAVKKFIPSQHDSRGREQHKTRILDIYFKILIHLNSLRTLGGGGGNIASDERELTSQQSWAVCFKLSLLLVPTTSISCMDSLCFCFHLTASVPCLSVWTSVLLFLMDWSSPVKLMQIAPCSMIHVIFVQAGWPFFPLRTRTRMPR